METATAAILIVGFLFLTAPVAAHMIGRAAYRHQVPRWTGTVIDESPSLDDSVDRAHEGQES
jgi:multicomponent Na+:H+ antiporter subunit G